jgi:hypothetical protein
MHLFGHDVPLAVVIVVGAAVAYVANYLILKALYGCSPDFTKCDWRQRLLWGIGLFIPISGVAMLVFATVVVILVFTLISLSLLINAVAHRHGST